jgi:hypothetical protein
VAGAIVLSAGDVIASAALIVLSAALRRAVSDDRRQARWGTPWEKAASLAVLIVSYSPPLVYALAYGGVSNPLVKL